jgi:anti-sigma-K factor RskA
MSTHDEIRGLIPAVALGAATEDERARVERHAAACAVCAADLDGMRGAAAGLALDVPQVAPPADLRKRVLGQVAADARRRGAPAAAPARSRRAGLWPALAGALAVVVVALVAWNVTLRTGEEPTALACGQGASVATCTLDRGDDGSAVLRISGLPPAGADEGYELWSIRDGVPRSEGFAARTAGGDLVAATADLESATALAVTVERRTNVTAPTMEPLVVVPL